MLYCLSQKETETIEDLQFSVLMQIQPNAPIINCVYADPELVVLTQKLKYAVLDYINRDFSDPKKFKEFLTNWEADEKTNTQED